MPLGEEIIAAREQELLDAEAQLELDGLDEAHQSVVEVAVAEATRKLRATNGELAAELRQTKALVNELQARLVELQAQPAAQTAPVPGPDPQLVQLADKLIEAQIALLEERRSARLLEVQLLDMQLATLRRATQKKAVPAA